MTPFKAVYGRPVPRILNHEHGSTAVNDVEVQLRDRDALLHELKVNLEAAQNRMKQKADKHRRAEEFDVGDWVYLKLQPYRQHSVFKRVNQKLTSRFFGPFQAEEKIGQVAYRLKLPSDAKIHPVFHVSLLRRRIGEGRIVQLALPPYAEDGLPIVEPEAILNYRWVPRGDGKSKEALVKWQVLPAEEATWEPVDTLKQQFPSLNLEDKVCLEEGSVDTDRLLVRRSSRAIRPNPRYQDY